MSGSATVYDMRILWDFALVALLAGWIAFCEYLSSKMRKIVWEDHATFPTIWSDLFRLLGLLGVLIVLGIELFRAIMWWPVGK